MGEEEKQKPKVRFVSLSKEGRGYNFSANRENHRIIYGIHADGYYVPKDPSNSRWINIEDHTCTVLSKGERGYGELVHCPISELIHKVGDSLYSFTDYKITFDPSKGMVISTLEAFPYEEELKNEWNYCGGYMGQISPGDETCDKWKLSHSHNIWFRETDSEDLDKLVKTLLSDGFKQSSRSRTEDPVQFSKAICGLLKSISTYHYVKYNQDADLYLERSFW